MSQTPEKHDLLLRTEVANLLRISAWTLAKWASNGVGPNYVRVGNKCLYPRNKLEQWIAEQGR